MTKKSLFIFFFFFCGLFCSMGQSLSGQWKGVFVDKSSAYGNFSGDRCEYVLELDIQGKSVTGSSYTYFTEGGKRYYTICKVVGWMDSRSKYIEVEETSRVKTNIPNDIRNCFQTHKLTYYKKGETETLEGSWVPAPNQAGGCGYGNTTLQRRTLTKTIPTASNKPKEKPKEKPKTQPVAVNKEKNKQPKKNQDEIKKSVVKIEEKQSTVKTTDIKKTTPASDSTSKQKVSDDLSTMQQRKPVIVKTIEVENDHIIVDLYDNGEIDGDSVSIFYNGKLILGKKKLTDQPLHLVIDMDEDVEVNELVMFAENLGTIPPNSAVMVAKDGPNRYEVRISSDLKNSGVIRFIHKKPQ